MTEALSQTSNMSSELDRRAVSLVFNIAADDGRMAALMVCVCTRDIEVCR